MRSRVPRAVPNAAAGSTVERPRVCTAPLRGSRCAMVGFRAQNGREFAHWGTSALCQQPTFEDAQRYHMAAEILFRHARFPKTIEQAIQGRFMHANKLTADEMN